MDFANNVLSIKGVGEKSANLFLKLDICSIKDLMHYVPRDYEYIQDVVSIDQLEEKKVQAVRCVVSQVLPAKKIRNLSITNVVVRDSSGMLTLTFFNQAYIKNVLKPGASFIFRGLCQKKSGQCKLEQVSMYNQSQWEQLCGKLIPKYNLTKGLSNNFISSSIKQCLQQLDFSRDLLPEFVKRKFQLCPLEQAYQQIHFPDSMEECLEARRRLAFDELFLFIYMIKKQRTHSLQIKNNFKIKEKPIVNSFLQGLPYQLTTAQLRTFEEIKADLLGPYTMNRLIQGDVGSGKTILALLSLLLVASNGYQGALMAPTEVLARQHMESFLEMTEQYHLPFKPVLLVGSMTAKQKREAYQLLADGEANIAIGTHAIIQEKVNFHKLSLVITDEQHRFGVRQREHLASKGYMPHVMVMSATPIPRSLAMILYGDMHLSLVDELPSNRLEKKNCVVNTNYRNTAYQFIQKEVEKKRQAYVICPMVEASEDEDNQLENVLEYSEVLKQHMDPLVRIQYLHGKMKAKEKTEIMERFVNHELDVLVSTTVIEVGINVPNATVIMVENSERFGLSTLHQLRGRVGRGKEQSYCIFVSGKDDKKTMERLGILGKSNDGFFIANEDLRLRGPGDMFGIRQSGDFDFEIADIYKDAELLKLCSDLVEDLLENRELEEDFSEYFQQSRFNILDFRTI